MSAPDSDTLRAMLAAAELAIVATDIAAEVLVLREQVAATRAAVVEYIAARDDYDRRYPSEGPWGRLPLIDRLEDATKALGEAVGVDL